jgi:hypothetical protein
MPRIRPPEFPELEKQILMHSVRKKDIAEKLHITARAFSSKLTGRVEFTLHEVEQIAALFPDVEWAKLFERNKPSPA